MKKRVFFILFSLIFLLATFLRLKNITSTPPSPYWEEVALGYDAYSILKTGRDHHANVWPIAAFESFGDWKPSLYFYVLVPFIKVFGLNLLAIRLPSVLAGLATVLGTGVLVFLLSKDLIKKKKDQRILFLLGFLVTALSPWAISFSRAAWESNFATALILWGVNFFLFFIEKPKEKKFLAVLSVFFLILATYCYHAARIIAPLLGLALLFLYILQSKKKTNWRLIIFLGILSLFLMLPLLKSLGSNVGQQRFMETSIFSDISIIEKSNQLRAESGNSLWSRLVYHRYLLFGKEILINFFDHFSWQYLFISGDTNPRHSIQSFGQLYLFEVLFLVLGIVFMVKNWSSKFGFLVFYLFLAIFPASLTKTTPHALRTLAALPIYMVIIILGIWQTLELLSKEFLKKFFLSALILIYLFNIFIFWQALNNDYPKEYSSEWQHGYQEIIPLIKIRQNDYDQVFVTREQGRPAMYYWFYTQTDPSRVQSWEMKAKKDQGEFLEFENIKFVNGAGEIGGEALVASSPKVFKELSEKQKPRELAEIKNLAGEIIWKLYVIGEK